jgi:hypothetical protein
MEYQIYTVNPVTGPELWGWCYGECELDFFVEQLVDEGYVVQVRTV